MTLRKSTDLLVVHVTATPPTMDIGVKEVTKMHLARGFNGVGYHYVIRRNGVIEAGRAEDQIGAHVSGFNARSIGVSLVGGVDAKNKPENNMTAAQFQSLETLLRKLSAKYPKAKICGHRDLSPDLDGDGIIEPQEHMKACPCFDAIPWARSKGLPAASIKGVWKDTDAKPAPVAPPVAKPSPPPVKVVAPVAPPPILPMPQTPPQPASSGFLNALIAAILKLLGVKK